jgi:hypothetical protein
MRTVNIILCMVGIGCFLLRQGIVTTLRHTELMTNLSPDVEGTNQVNGLGVQIG